MFDFYEKLFTLSHEKKLSRREVGLAAWLIAGNSCAIPPILEGAFSGFLTFVFLATLLVTMFFFVSDFFVFFAGTIRAKLRNTFLDFFYRQLRRTFTVEESAQLVAEVRSDSLALRDLRASNPEKIDYSLHLGAFLRVHGLAPSFPV